MLSYYLAPIPWNSYQLVNMFFNTLWGKLVSKWKGVKQRGLKSNITQDAENIWNCIYKWPNICGIDPRKENSVEFVCCVSVKSSSFLVVARLHKSSEKTSSSRFLFFFLKEKNGSQPTNKQTDEQRLWLIQQIFFSLYTDRYQWPGFKNTILSETRTTDSLYSCCPSFSWSYCYVWPDWKYLLAFDPFVSQRVV